MKYILIMNSIKTYKIYITTFLVFFFFNTLLFAQSNINTANKKVASYQNFFDYCYENSLFNGNVLVIEKGEVLFEKSFGYTNLNKDEEIDLDTKFMLASLSKQFTATAIVLLKRKGKLSYDNKVNQYIDDFPYPNITIRQLLNHTSGIPEYQDFFNKQRAQLTKRFESTGKRLTNENVISMYAKHKPPLDFAPGSQFNYSNTGYVVLASIIEKVSRLSFGEFLDKRIFIPLRMHNTAVYNGNITNNMAIGYKLDIRTNSLVNNHTPDFFAVLGDGGIYSSINDFIKWDAALRDGTIINKEDLKDMYALPNLIDSSPSRYGFGWFVRQLPFNGNTVLTHSGRFAGYTNSIFRDLTTENTIVILSNNSHKINEEINSATVRILYDKPYQLPKLKASVVLYQLIVNEGIKKGRTFYNSNKKNEKYDFSERELNTLGYELIRNTSLKDAIEVFKWNVVAHPNSSNVYDSLGEAYLQLGNKKEALKNYKIAFEKDPKNDKTKAIIKKLESN